MLTQELIRTGARRPSCSAILCALCASMATNAGCQQQMSKQPKYLPLEASEFFEDGRSARPLVPGTVARGHLKTDARLFAGSREAFAGKTFAPGLVPAGGRKAPAGSDAALDEGKYHDTFPFPVTRAVLERGQQRFTIYCAVCHGPLGDGNGIVVQRGF